MISELLNRARRSVAAGDGQAAQLAYLDVLRVDQQHCAALKELGALAHATGHASAARHAFRQAVRCHPRDKSAQAGYAWLLSEAGEPAEAAGHYQAALAIDPDLYPARQGLARVLTELGQNADQHWRAGFTGHAVERQRYRGPGVGIPVLMLAAAVGGNIPMQPWIDDRVYAVTAIYADYFDPADQLPEHAVLVNAIGDADLCGAALAGAERIVLRSTAPLINAPALVRQTGREANARRLGAIAGVIAPRIVPLRRAGDFRFPFLLRAAGFHTGQHFHYVSGRAELADAAAMLPGGDALAIEYLDARGPDGMARKYRVMFIGGRLYPLHLAISESWKVHYFTAAMRADPAFRMEESRFLNGMETVIGGPAMVALEQIQAALGLDYAGIDFAIAADRRVMVFEANTTMAIIPPDPDPIWDYRRPAVDAALAAARELLLDRSLV